MLQLLAAGLHKAVAKCALLQSPIGHSGRALFFCAHSASVPSSGSLTATRILPAFTLKL